jgi:ribosomal-protein-alanine N-acetyltransferase
MNHIRISGERVILREWSVGDGDAMHRLMGDAQVTRFLTWGPMTYADCARRLEGFIRDQDCRALRPSFWRRLSSLRGPWLWRGRRQHESSARPLDACTDQSQCARIRYYFAIETKEPCKVIGEVGFEWITDDSGGRAGELGYFLERDFWGHGYATEAALLVIDFAFETLGANAVRAECDPRNAASEGVMRKCGLEPDPDVSSSRQLTRSIARARWQLTNADHLQSRGRL